MAEPVLLICGFGRCGSSLVMQMLQAGGFPVHGQWPDFEEQISSDTAMGIARADRWEPLAGRAVKLLDAHRGLPPSGIDYRAIWLTRDPRQQARSMAKFSKAMMGLEFGRIGVRNLERSFIRDEPRAIEMLRKLCGRIPTLMEFENIILHPRTAAEIIEHAAGHPLAREKMVATVRPRPTTCLPGLLEFDMMQEAERG